jgi:hypothetical protein
MSILPGDTACLRCLIADAPPPGTTPTCDTAGILAPIVNVIVSLLWKTKQAPGPLFFVGIVLAALGAGLVLYSKNVLDAEQKKSKQAAAQPLTRAQGS